MDLNMTSPHICHIFKIMALFKRLPQLRMGLKDGACRNFSQKLKWLSSFKQSPEKLPQCGVQSWNTLRRIQGGTWWVKSKSVASKRMDVRRERVKGTETIDWTDLSGRMYIRRERVSWPLSTISAKSGRQLPTGGRWPVMMALPRVTRALFGLVKILILTQPNDFLSCKWGWATMGLKDEAHRNFSQK